MLLYGVLINYYKTVHVIIHELERANDGMLMTTACGQPPAILLPQKDSGIRRDVQDVSQDEDGCRNVLEDGA